MKSLHPVGLILIFVVAIGAGGGVGYSLGKSNHAAVGDKKEEAEATTTPTSEPAPTADVKTMPTTESEISSTLTAYGTIVVPPTARQGVIWSLESRVVQLLVLQGQSVQAGDRLAEIEPSPEVTIAYRQARSALETASRALKNVQERYDLKLATTQERQTAEAAVSDAQLKVHDLESRGANVKQTLIAPLSGVVAKINATPGQIVAPGTSFMDIEDQSHLEARISIHPEDLSRVKAGESIHIAASGAEEVVAPIRMINRQIDADTQMASAFVSLPAGGSWIIGAPLVATIALESKKALVVPRNAVLDDDGQHVLYTVSDDHAVRHAITIGLQNNQAVEIAKSEPQVRTGDAVVIEGNYELEDGMSVQVDSKP